MDVDREPGTRQDLGVVDQQRQPNKERITTPYLTKYERARILGTRALQIRYVVLGGESVRLAKTFLPTTNLLFLVV
jgi:hypothetical protein